MKSESTLAALPGRALEPPGISSKRWMVPIACLAVWAGFLPGMIRHVSLLRTDRVFYQEAAESLVDGRGLMHRPIYEIGTEGWVPLTVWSSGYPVATAALHAIGLPVHDAALIVDLIFGGVLVLLVCWFCLRLLPPVVALPVALTAVMMHTFLEQCANGMSDIPYAAMTAASLVCLIQWSDNRMSSVIWLFWAGLFAGAAYTMRYVGICLFPPTVLFILFFSMRCSLARTCGNLAAWLVGVAICSVPMTLAGQTATGYYWPKGAPSSYWTIAKDSAITMLSDMTTTYKLNPILVDKYLLMGFGLVLVCASLVVLAKFSIGEIYLAFLKLMPLVVIVGFALVYMVLFVIARTNHEGEGADSRYFIPVYWIIFVVLASCLWNGLRGLGVPEVAGKLLLVCLFGVLCSLQINHHLQRLSYLPEECRSVQDWLGQEQGDLLCAVPNRQLILSSHADLLRLFGLTNARFLSHAKYKNSTQPGFECHARAALKEAGETGRFWGIVIVEERRLKYAREGGYGEVIQQLIDRPESFPEYERLALPGPALVFRYRMRNSQTHLSQ